MSIEVKGPSAIESLIKTKHMKEVEIKFKDLDPSAVFNFSKDTVTIKDCQYPAFMNNISAFRNNVPDPHAQEDIEKATIDGYHKMEHDYLIIRNKIGVGTLPLDILPEKTLACYTINDIGERSLSYPRLSYTVTQKIHNTARLVENILNEHEKNIESCSAITTGIFGQNKDHYYF